MRHLHHQTTGAVPSSALATATNPATSPAFTAAVSDPPLRFPPRQMMTTATATIFTRKTPMKDTDAPRVSSETASVNIILYYCSWCMCWIVCCCITGTASLDLRRVLRAAQSMQIGVMYLRFRCPSCLRMLTNSCLPGIDLPLLSMRVPVVGEPILHSAHV